jgi:hypothetical protein
VRLCAHGPPSAGGSSRHAEHPRPQPEYPPHTGMGGLPITIIATLALTLTIIALLLTRL